MTITSKNLLTPPIEEMPLSEKFNDLTNQIEQLIGDEDILEVDSINELINPKEQVQYLLRTHKKTKKLIDEYEDIWVDSLDKKNQNNDFYSKNIKILEKTLDQLKKQADLIRSNRSKAKSILSKPFSSYPEAEKLFSNNLTLKDPDDVEKNITKILLIAQEIQKGHFNIGEGNTALVFHSEKNPDICAKIIKENSETYQESNQVSQEAEILCYLLPLNERFKTKIPIPYYYFQDENQHFYLMEKLNAINLSNAIADEELPDNFNFEEFFDDLEAFVKQMHEMQVHHRDLTSQNIMIDRKTGHARIIDFGKSTFKSLAEDPYLQAVEKRQPGGKLEKVARGWFRDLEEIQKIKMQVRKILRKQNKLDK